MRDSVLDSAAAPVARALKAAHDGKLADARERWDAFNAAQKAALSNCGGDLLKVSAEDAKRLDDLHSEYRAAADSADELRDRLFAHVGGDGKRLDGAGREGRIGGIGSAFLKNVGHGGVELKALTTGGAVVGPFFDPKIRDLPQRQLFVRSVIPTRKAESDRIWYLRQTVANHAAAVVAAGAEKPRSTYTIERIEEEVVTIAHVTEALDRALLADLDELIDFLDSQLRLGVLLAEENQILNGDGVGANMLGILNTPGIGSLARNVAGNETRADAIYRGITNCRLAFFEPDAIVLHPSDWQDVRLEKTTDGEYLTGPVTDTDAERLFGKQVITSPVLTVGEGLVGAFADGATWYDREEARVTFTESGLGDAAGQELFTRNLVRFRGEERGALAVERPAAFCEVTAL